MDGLDSCAELSNVIRQSGAYKAIYLRESAGGGPGRACSAVQVAVVEGRAISPDMLPISRHPAQASKGNRGGRHIFLEEPPVSKVIPKAVRSSKEGLWRIKQLDTAESIGHGGPCADVFAMKRCVRPPLAIMPLGEREGLDDSHAGGGQGLEARLGGRGI